MSIVGTLSALNGNLTSTLTDSDLLQPTLNGAYSDDYQLIDVILGQSVTIELMSDDYDTYLQLINADTGFVITENNDYEDETLNSGLSFIAAEGINYIVRVSGSDETEIGIYQLSAISTDPVLTHPGDGYGGDGYGGDGYGGDGEFQSSNLTIINIDPLSIGYTDSTIDVSWTVKNIGDTNTANTGWYDYVYLSQNDTYDDIDISLNPYYVYFTPLAVGDSYKGSNYITIPDVESGSYYLLFYTDRTNKILETNETDNITAVPFEVIQSDIDLSVSDVNIPDKVEPGQRITIDYTKKNNGSTPIEGRSWIDKIYLSQEEYFLKMTRQIMFIQFQYP